MNMNVNTINSRLNVGSYKHPAGAYGVNKWWTAHGLPDLQM